jgi:hypothetical protein
MDTLLIYYNKYSVKNIDYGYVLTFLKILKKERVRFELTEPFSSSDFKSDAIDHSAIFPKIEN